MSIRLNNSPPISPLVTGSARKLSHALQWRLLRIALLVTDCVMVALAFTGAYWLRFNPYFNFWQTDEPFALDYRLLGIQLVAVWIGSFVIMQLYRRSNLFGGVEEYRLIFWACTLSSLLVIVVGFLNPLMLLARGWLLLTWLLSTFFVMVGRFLLRRIVYRLRSYGYFLSRTLIIGVNEEGRSVAEQLISWRTSGLDVIGFVSDDLESGARVTDHLYNFGRISNLIQLVDTHQIDELVIVSSALQRDELVKIFRQYAFDPNVKIRLTSGLYEIVTTGLEVRELAGAPLVRISRAKLRGVDYALKRTLDFCVASAVIVLLSPIFAFIAVRIWRHDGSPIIYRRRVVGMNGREFDAFKFRTMVVKGEEVLAKHPDKLEELGRTHKILDDPRITPIGHFLRKSSLDELPQFFNVLRGEMSVVGPRMISPPELASYQKWDLNLLMIRPGITGLWQVSGRSDIAYDERVQIDMQYIRNWTIWLDLQIMLQTVPVIVYGRGAY